MIIEKIEVLAQCCPYSAARPQPQGINSHGELDAPFSRISSVFIKKEEKVKKYKCTVCGYIYDPAVGDPDNGVQPGTAFEDIPDTWVCPECGVSKDDFEAVE